MSVKRSGRRKNLTAGRFCTLLASRDVDVVVAGALVTRTGEELRLGCDADDVVLAAGVCTAAGVLLTGVDAGILELVVVGDGVEEAMDELTADGVLLADGVEALAVLLTKGADRDDVAALGVLVELLQVGSDVTLDDATVDDTVVDDDAIVDDAVVDDAVADDAVVDDG